MKENVFFKLPGNTWHGIVLDVLIKIFPAHESPTGKDHPNECK